MKHNYNDFLYMLIEITLYIACLPCLPRYHTLIKRKTQRVGLPRSTGV